MSTFWNSLKKNLKHGLQTVSDRTDEITKIGRMKIEVIAIQRDIEKTFIELGGRVYELLKNSNKTSIQKDTEIKYLIDNVAQSEQRLKELKERIQNIQDMKRPEKRSENIR